MASKDVLNISLLNEQVAHALKDEIVSGRLPPGERIDIGVYSKAWSISSTPLRDALKHLESQGLVDIIPRVGVFVAKLDQKALKEIFELRIALESLAVELATRAIPADSANSALECYSKAFNAAPRERNKHLAKVDYLVHKLVIEYCGNDRLVKMMGGLSDLIKWSQQTIIRDLREPYETTLPEHIEICEAICARNPERASRAMRVHLENTYERWKAELEASTKGSNASGESANTKVRTLRRDVA